MKRAFLLPLAVLVVSGACGDEDQTSPILTHPRLSPTLFEASASGSATVITDKDDYAPGEVVTVTGSGWLAGETVSMVLHEEPVVHGDRTLSSVADENGNFINTSFRPEDHDIGVMFTLVATGQTSGLTAQTTFTDGNLQIRSGANAPTPNPFSPNADGVKDAVVVTVRNAGAGNVTNVFVRIRVGTGLVASSALVREFSLGTINQNTDAVVNWDGKNTGGIVQADGNYTARIFSTTAAQNQPEDETQARKATLIVDNTAPVVSNVAALPNSVVSGSATPVTLTGTATDPLAAGVAANNYRITSAEYNIDGGAFSNMTAVDGSFNQQIEDVTATVPGATIAGLSVGPHLLCVRATDDVGNRSPNNTAGNANCATLEVTATNQPPTANAAGPYSGNEGSAINISGTASDPDGDTLTKTWSYAVVTAAAGASCSFGDGNALSTTVTCNDNGSYTLTLTVSDGKAAPVTSNATLTVGNVAPTATKLNVPAADVNEGSSFALSLQSPTDASSNDVAAGLQFAFDCGDGGGYDAASTTNSASCPTTDNGTRSVRGKVLDKDGDSSEYTGSVTVVNVAPTATFNAPSSVDEGTDIDLSLTAPSDPSSADVAAGFRYAFDCGSGYGSATSYATAGTDNSVSCPTDDNGTRNVKGKIFDKDDGSTEYPASITINNVPPSITSMTEPDGDPLPAQITVGGTLDLKVNFTDPGSADTHTAEIDCGTGTGFSDVNGGSDVTTGFTASCTFASVGSKTVTVRVTDDDGDFDEESHVLNVLYDFQGFFRPVDNPGPLYVLNIVKAGQAIPLRWQLSDAFGNPITTLSGVTVTVSSLNCGLSTTTDLLEEVAAGASGLQNLGGGNYQFNWKSPTMYANSCKTLNLDLGEGSPSSPVYHSALFKFTR